MTWLNLSEALLIGSAIMLEMTFLAWTFRVMKLGWKNWLWVTESFWIIIKVSIGVRMTRFLANDLLTTHRATHQICYMLDIQFAISCTIESRFSFTFRLYLFPKNRILITHIEDVSWIRKVKTLFILAGKFIRVTGLPSWTPLTREHSWLFLGWFVT